MSYHFNIIRGLGMKVLKNITFSSEGEEKNRHLAFYKKEIVGVIDITIYEDTIDIIRYEVKVKYRRNEIARNLFNYMLKSHENINKITVSPSPETNSFFDEDEENKKISKSDLIEFYTKLGFKREDSLCYGETIWMQYNIL